MDFQEINKIYSARADLQPYSQHALMLWALQIRYQIEDIEEFASSCLTDNSDDKKCDLIWVNRDEGFAIIAQDYFSTKAKKAKYISPPKAGIYIIYLLHLHLQRSYHVILTKYLFNSKNISGGVNPSARG